VETKHSNSLLAHSNTIPHSTANINISKLDAAFDIDPLFHKMSKTFDEGGAKGLLLANLNVSAVGCNIVFDSTLDNDTAEEQVSSENDDNGDVGMADAATGPLTSVDVSSLTARLESSLPNGQTVHQMPLVPQLVSLRSEFAQLKEEGFVENVKAVRILSMLCSM
jgi:condensin complex subunit 2